MAGGRTPTNCGWFSGKPSRPAPGAGVAHTGRRRRSANSTPTSQAPEASISGPAASTGFFASRIRAANCWIVSGQAVARPPTRRDD